MDHQRVLEVNAKNVAEFRASGGALSAFGAAPVLLLTTIGVKSGEPRVNPMMYLADDDRPDRVYVFASAAGADKDPAWVGNLVARPDDITVEIGAERLQAHAQLLDEPSRAATYARQASLYPGFGRYQAMTERAIPVAALDLRRGVPTSSFHHTQGAPR